MEKLKELLALCKCSVTIEVNNHKDCYQSVKEYIEEKDSYIDDFINDIGLEVYQKMIDTDSIIEIQAYPNTPISFYVVCHYDLDSALDIILSQIKNNL